jgi:hypothetical protein
MVGVACLNKRQRGDGQVMVQVDVFWSYGLGATFAVAASKQLIEQRRVRRERPRSRWDDPYLVRTLLFLALVFVPSGVYLVWAFPGWETMHVGDRDMPAWLVTLFAATNVTQGLLGFFVTEWLIARGRTYLAYLQIVAGYLGMFFLLVHGWDGTGYQRFFSPTGADFAAWDGDWTAFLTSDVALTLYVMGAVLIPVLLVTVARWAGPKAPVLTLATVFGVALGIAVAAHLAITWLGPALGVPAALAVAAAALAPKGPAHRLHGALAA